MESNNETSTTGINLNPLMARYKFDVSLSQLEDNYLETLDQSFTGMIVLYCFTIINNQNLYLFFVRIIIFEFLRLYIC